MTFTLTRKYDGQYEKVVEFCASFDQMDQNWGMSSLAEMVAKVAQGLRADVEAVARHNAQAVAAQVPELHAARLEEILLISCRANNIVVMDALVAGVQPEAVELSAEALGYIRTLVVSGISLDVVSKAYRVGAYDTVERWAKAVADSFATDPGAVPVAAYGTRFLLTWMDNVLAQMAHEFRIEDERITRERTLRRLADVRLLLSNAPTDLSAVETRLGYRLTGVHRGVVLRAADPGVDLARAARSLFGDAAFLQVPLDGATMWCWGPELIEPESVADVWVGVGRARAGVDGFRATHAEAAEAIRVAELRPEGAVALIDEVAVTALCVVDPHRAREFVATALGALAADTDAARRQRETLQAFLEAGMNSRRAGAELGLHHNTVRYRLAQIDEVLGRPIVDHRLELELALRLHADLGS
ncbi:PucR family transcriptional regulator [Gordonia phosphorivorans]|uniref:PucR family transcriptional regulator n=1 Tax=Gordonia phosphorivorans TaxID=1056982 RepID=A0ABV6H5B2_9ACTN